MKKFPVVHGILAVMVACLPLFVLSGPASAAERHRSAVARAAMWCSKCYVTSAGVGTNSSLVMVMIFDPQHRFSERWFEARSNQQNVLATALAAVTSGKSVTVALVDTVEYSAIDRIYLNRK